METTNPNRSTKKAVSAEESPILGGRSSQEDAALPRPEASAEALAAEALAAETLAAEALGALRTAPDRSAVAAGVPRSMLEPALPVAAGISLEPRVDGVDTEDIQFVLVDYAWGADERALKQHPELREWLRRGWHIRSAEPRLLEGVGTRLFVVLARRG